MTNRGQDVLDAAALPGDIDRQQLKPSDRPGFRPDIQGLRAIAVGLVLIYHAGANWLPGGFVGVDVFFVISGFLITGLLIKEGRSQAHISLADFYGRRARRILPAATVTLVFSAVLTIIFLPPTRWETTMHQIIQAALYYVNWGLASDSVDYLAADQAESIVQHFWSLAVEEQFYIIWPLLLIVAMRISRRRNRRLGRRHFDEHRFFISSLVMALLVTGASLAWSIYYSPVNPGKAYFVTTTRLWELGIGALTAILATRLQRLNHAAGLVLGCAGLVAVIGSGILIDAQSVVFPGAIALVPTLGTSAMIVAGMGGRANRGVGVLLSTKPFTFIGDISYSLYLWHWPLIVVVTYKVGGDLEFYQGLITVLASIPVAWASRALLERQIEKAEGLRATSTQLQMGVALVACGVVAGSTVGWAHFRDVVNTPTAPSIAANYSIRDNTSGDDTATPKLGAAYLAAHPEAGQPAKKAGAFTPSVEDAYDDNSDVYRLGCHQEFDDVDPASCEFGDPDGTYKVALVGDSHAAQWQPAVTVIANDYGWNLSTYTKSACGFFDAEISDPRLATRVYDPCVTWNDNVMQELLDSKPDLVITASFQYNIHDSGGFVVGSAAVSEQGAALNRTWKQLEQAGIQVVALDDTPNMALDVPECVAANKDDLSPCDVPADTALAQFGNPEEVGAKGTNATVLDLNNYICPAAACPPIIGKVLIYRDNTHLTASYSRTLASPLADALGGVLPNSSGLSPAGTPAARPAI